MPHRLKQANGLCAFTTSALVIQYGIPLQGFITKENVG